MLLLWKNLNNERFGNHCSEFFPIWQEVKYRHVIVKLHLLLCFLFICWYSFIKQCPYFDCLLYLGLSPSACLDTLVIYYFLQNKGYYYTKITIYQNKGINKGDYPNLSHRPESGGSTPQHPRKIYSTTMLQKFDSTSLLNKHHKDFPDRHSKKFCWASGWIFWRIFIIIFHLKQAKKWLPFYVKVCNIAKKPIQAFWPLWLMAIFRWYW